jgi:DNA replication protein DnaC
MAHHETNRQVIHSSKAKRCSDEADHLSAIHQGKRVRFFNAVDLVNQLEREKQQGKAGNMARQLVPTDAVILDELGYLPFPASGGALLFHLISQLYEKTSLIVTTNLSFK